MFTELIVVMASQYVYDKPLYCTHKTYMVLFFNYIQENPYISIVSGQTRKKKYGPLKTSLKI